MLEALDSVARMISGRTEAEFLTDETRCFAIAHRLTVVGEAAARLSDGVKGRHSLIPWQDVVGDHAPTLRRQIAEILGIEFPE